MSITNALKFPQNTLNNTSNRGFNFKSYFKNSYFLVFCLCFLTAFFIFLPFLIFDKGLFLYYGDYNVQQIPFYSMAHEAVRNGDFGWNWYTDLGANFIGSYSFYLLGSPFFWITTIFPNSFVPYLMAPMFMLKFALTGVTGFAYIKRFCKNDNICIICAMMYSFSGFNIYNIFFNHFNEVVMVFPLLLIALEELVINNRRGGFALAVALCCVVNYYFFFGQVIFVVLYFILRCFSDDFNINFKKFLIIAFEAIIGLFLACFLLVPSILAIISNPRTSETISGFNSIVYGNPQRYGLIISSLFFPPDIPARPNFFPDSNAKWSSVSLFLPLFTTTGVFAYFKGAKSSFIKKLLVICFAISLVPILNSAFSAFNYSYYARWFYMPLLIMAVATAIALDKHTEDFKFSIGLTATFIICFSFIGILPKVVDDKKVYFQLPEYVDRFWVYVLISIVCVLTVFLIHSLNKNSKVFFKATVSSLMAITVIYSCFMIFCGKTAGYDYNVVVNQAINGRDKIHLEEEDFYRIDTFDEMDNMGMYWRIPTINAFHSVVPSSIMDYYELIGAERGVASRPERFYEGVRALNSVKYVFQSADKKEEAVQLGFSYYDTQNGYRIYKNDYFVPMGFTYNRSITKIQLDNSAKASRDTLLLNALHLSNEDIEKYKDILPVISDNEIDSISLLEEAYFDACNKLAKNSATSFSYDSNGFKSTITTAKDNLVFFSVPYDKGFKAYVNGKETEIVKANGGFMAVKVQSGTNEIVFEYHTPGLVLGAIISFIALVILLIYYFYIRKLRKTNPEKYAYNKYAHINVEENTPDILTRDAYIVNNFLE